ncbi:MAG: UbiA prenyltransferase family protein [Candidatus Thorarchaeota archaeon]|jgi:4-hydroxybenzoate polyprenyltransferase
MSAKQYFKLMRPHQWYKNLLVFLAIIFVEIPTTWPWDTLPAVLNLSNYPPLILGFIALCLVSSAGYIINDIKDLEQDAAHPEKKLRPLPSGEVSRQSSLVLAASLMISSLLLAYVLNGVFFLLVIFYIINSQLYNYFLRLWAVVDVVAISVGFIIRAIAGTFLIGVPFTSWLIVGVFFVSLVLGFGKRKNELQLLEEDAAVHKPVFNQYTEAVLDQGIMMSATWVILFYTLYCYNNFGNVMITQPVMLTVPIAAGIALRYVYLIQIGSPVGRKPHLAIKDKGILVGVILFAIVLAVTLFFWVPIFEFFLELFPPLFPQV